MQQSPFEIARSLAQTTAARAEQRALRERLAKALTDQDRIGIQVRTGDQRVARVMLSPVAARPNKRQRVDRLVRQLHIHAEDIYENRENTGRLRVVAAHIMRAVDHRETTGKRNVTVRIVATDEQETVADAVKPEPVDVQCADARAP